MSNIRKTILTYRIREWMRGCSAKVRPFIRYLEVISESNQSWQRIIKNCFLRTTKRTSQFKSTICNQLSDRWLDSRPKTKQGRTLRFQLSIKNKGRQSNEKRSHLWKCNQLNPKRSNHPRCFRMHLHFHPGLEIRLLLGRMDAIRQLAFTRGTFLKY